MFYPALDQVDLEQARAQAKRAELNNELALTKESYLLLPASLS